MSETTARPQHGHEQHSHLGRYVIVWVALLALTAATFFAARVHLPGAWHVTVALLIASVKGGLVALFFMHLWDEAGAPRLIFVTAVAFVALLIGLVLADNATRFPLANPPGAAGALPMGGADRDPPATIR